MWLHLHSICGKVETLLKRLLEMARTLVAQGIYLTIEKCLLLLFLLLNLFSLIKYAFLLNLFIYEIITSNRIKNNRLLRIMYSL